MTTLTFRNPVDVDAIDMNGKDINLTVTAVKYDSKDFRETENITSMTVELLGNTFEVGMDDVSVDDWSYNNLVDRIHRHENRKAARKSVVEAEKKAEEVVNKPAQVVTPNQAVVFHFFWGVN